MMTVQDIREEITNRYGENAPFILARDDMRMELEYVGRSQDKEEPFNGYHEQAIENALKRAGELHERILTPATAKVGDGATICYWSDREACTIIKVTKSTVTVRRDKAKLDPDFKPEFIPGGFSAHCTNQGEQTYTYEPDPDGHVTTFHWSKKFGTYGTPGNLRLIRGRHEFYDYNF